MGILAPLYPAQENPSFLVLKTGREPFFYSFWLFGFAAVVLLMNNAVHPMTVAIREIDPFFSKAIPATLTTLEFIFLALGVLLCGYRKEIYASRPSGTLQTQSSFWGLPFKTKKWPWEAVKSIEAYNQTPKRYRPELYPRQRAVGFWKLRVRLETGEVIELDRAPQETEIQTLKECLQNFWAGIENKKKGPASSGPC